MAPPGSRTLPVFSWVLLSLFLFTLTASAASAVLGIDLGTEYIKAALVKPGIPLEIVLTKDSKRKEVAAVAFKSVQNAQSEAFPARIYGSDAIALAARIPGDVYPNLKPLLALTAERSGFVKEFKARHPALEVVPDEGRGTVAFRSKAFGENSQVFGVEELLAMEMQNIRSNAEAMAGKGSTVKDVVLTIPGFYTAEEIRALELAAELAGLNVLGLISDGLAVGINYATSRTFPSISEGGKPEYHLIFDMGATSTSATVVQFQGRTVKDVGRFNKTIQEVNILGIGWDRTLGGDSLNAIIVDQMASEFAQLPAARQLGIFSDTVKAHGRAAARMWKEAEKVRQVLSANSETVASFEGLYEDLDFRYKLSRAHLEELTSEFAGRLEGPVKRALDAAKLTFEDLDSIIMHGGASRTPFVQARLESLVGSSGKIRSNVNADEAAVFGAVFKAASLSPSFRVKEIRSRDASPYHVGVQWSTTEGKDRQQKIFLSTSQRGVEKYVSFNALQDFSFLLYQNVATDDGLSSFADLPISRIQTQNLTASVAHLVDKVGCAKENITAGFAFRLNTASGLPQVAYGSVSCELESHVKKGGVVDEVKGFFGFGHKNNEQKPLSDTTEEATPSSSDVESATPSSLAHSETSTVETSADVKSQGETKKRKETVYIDFTVSTEGTPVMTPTELKRIKERMSAFDASDESRRVREDILNSLEAFIYRTRDLLTEESFVAASNNKDRDELETKLHEASDWLSDGGVDAGREDLKNRLQELRSLVGPVEKRREEAIKRPREVELLREALDQTKMLVEAIAKQVENSEEEAAAAAASAAAAATTTASTSIDDFAELEDSTTSSSTTATASSSGLPTLPKYTAEDVSSLRASYNSIDGWLKAKLAEQEKLSPHDDPALLSADIAIKAKQLNKVVMEILQRQMRVPPKPKSSSKAKTKSKKTKSSASKSTATSRAAGEEATFRPEKEAEFTGDDGQDVLPDEQVQQDTSEKGKGKQSRHDEL